MLDSDLAIIYGYEVKRLKKFAGMMREKINMEVDTTSP